MLVGCALALRRVSPLERLVPKPLKNADFPADSDDDDVRVPKKVALMERYMPQPLDHANPSEEQLWYQVSQFALIAFLLHRFFVTNLLNDYFH